MQVAGVAGNALEWYDFSCFGYFSDFFALNFFPAEQSYQSKLILSFVIFGAAFVVRPIGGALIGFIGDANTGAVRSSNNSTPTAVVGEDSRIKAVRISILIMVIPTFALGCLPTYEQVGYMATILLIVTRLIQGISVGGQIMSSAVLAIERAPKEQWGFWGSTVFTASSVGVTIGSAVSYTLRQSMSKENLAKWGWRIPFWFALLGAIPSYYLKDTNEEEECDAAPPPSPPPRSLMTSNDSNGDSHGSLGETHIIKENRSHIQGTSSSLCSRSNQLSLLSCTLVVFFPAAFYYIVFIWLATYMESIRDPPMPHAFGINTVVGLVSLPLNLVGGYVTDTLCSSSYRLCGYGITYKSIMFVSATCSALVAPLLLYELSLPTATVFLALFFQLIMGTLLAAYTGSMLPFLVSIFPPHVRLTSMSLGYNIGICLCGGFAPALATYLVGTSYGITSVGLYITILSFVSCIGIYLGPTHRWNEVEEEEVVVEEEVAENDAHTGWNKVEEEEVVVAEYDNHTGIALTEYHCNYDA